MVQTSNADTEDDLNLLDLTASVYLAPSEGSSAASIFESRFMLLA